VSWDSSGTSEEALVEWGKAVGEMHGVNRAKGTFHQDLSNLATNVSGRPGLTKGDYYRFRPDEDIPTKHCDIMNTTDNIYHTVGLVRNIVDLMGDFAGQGVRLVHPNPRIQKFHRNWWKKVHGTERSERFLNYLYRLGTVVMQKQMAKISIKTERVLYKSAAKPDVQVKHTPTVKREIPWKYNFLNPATVDVVGGPLASFVGDPMYMVVLPSCLCRTIKSPRTTAEKALVAKLPADLKKAAKNNNGYPLDPERTSVHSYKKDDWQAFAKPMVYAILSDVALLEKLQLADMAALDGAISNIRIFKIGSLEHKVTPTRVAAARLSEILESHTGVGTMDFVWGPDIELLESNTTVHQFLGEEKYKPTLNAIYAGLGIPPTLTGTFGAAGTTNNYISLKTLTQRLQYGRDRLVEFWEQELAQVQKAMGFRFPAKVEFDLNTLTDEVAEKALLIQLADRNLISDELIQHRFGNDPDLERIRQQREQRERETGSRPNKSSPYHDPQFGLALKKLALQTGAVTPGQVGLREDGVHRGMKTFKKQKGEQTSLEMRQPKPAPSGKSGQPQQGRPKNSKDTKKRKDKEFKPKNKAVVEIWARGVQLAVGEFLVPYILDLYGKKNMRQLTSKESADFEKVKFDTLCNLEPLGVVDETTVKAALDAGPAPSELNQLRQDWIKEISTTLNRKLNIDEIKHMQSCLYAAYIGDE
jgi:hypothetical protein